MMWMDSLKRLINTFFKQGEGRPIGLKPFNEYTNDELLNHLSTPSLPLPPLRPSLSKKAVCKTAPAFAKVPQTEYTYQNYQQLRQYPAYPRRSL